MKISFSNNKNSDATVKNNIKIPYGNAKRIFPQLKWWLVLIIIALPFVYFSGKIISEWLFVRSPGTIYLEKVVVNANEGGTIESIAGKRGDMIAPNSLLLTYKKIIPTGRLEQIALLEAEKNALVTGNIGGGTTVDKNYQQISAISNSVAYYEKLRNDTGALMAKGAATRAEYEQVNAKYNELKAALAAADVSPVAAPVLSNEVRKIQVDESIKSLTKFLDNNAQINTGIGGQINTILVNVGQTFSAGEPLAILAKTENVYVSVYVEPEDFKKISLGTGAKVKILGSNRTVTAVVVEQPISASTVPTGISNTIYPNSMRGINVFLKIDEKLNPEEIVDGLPVVVAWN